MLQISDGIFYFPHFLDLGQQQNLVEEIRQIVAQAPLYTPHMPLTGKPMSVRMTNCGVLGWVTDKERGYRYQSMHPANGQPWPPIPETLLYLWSELSNYEAPPEACLINFYEPTAKMGLHQDRDEANFDAPVVSISLGDSCLFRIANETRGGPSQSLKLHSGDVIIMGGKGRLAFHGVDRIYPATSTLLKNKGRINLTLRRVTKPKF